MQTLTGEVIDGMPEAEYHARPELSSSQARTLLRSPARYRYELGHPITPTREMLIGTATHTEVLGVGQPWAVRPAGDGRTKAVQQARAEWAATLAPDTIALDEDEATMVRGMAAAVRAHPEASHLLNPEIGIPERSLLWTDPETGVACRGRLDLWWGNGMGMTDLKTTGNANPSEIGRHIAKYSLHVQTGWYEQMARALGIVAPDSHWRWVFVERKPPHFVTVAQLDPEGMAEGHRLAAQARQMFRDCTDAGVWPTGYPEHTITVSLPSWHREPAYTEEY